MSGLFLKTIFKSKTLYHENPDSENKSRNYIVGFTYWYCYTVRGVLCLQKEIISVIKYFSGMLFINS
jgi:hypothetical protein